MVRQVAVADDPELTAGPEHPVRLEDHPPGRLVADGMVGVEGRVEQVEDPEAFAGSRGDLLATRRPVRRADVGGAVEGVRPFGDERDEMATRAVPT